MIKKIFIFVVAPLLIFGFASAGTIDGDESENYMQINVGLKSLSFSSDVTDLISQYGGQLVQEIPQLRNLTFKIPRTEFTIMAFDKLLDSLVDYIEEDYVRRIPPLQDIQIYPEEGGVELFPNDPNYPSQWGPPCIGAQDAWDLVLGDSNVIVAIVDTGIDLDHPDLITNVDTNIDWDFVNNDSNAQDDHGHGTHVAGTVAAEINNRIGVAGLQQVTLMAVKGLNQGGFSNAIRYAADNGARVINCSWGSNSYSSLIESAVNYAFSKGALVVAAAGNDGNAIPHYPAAYAKALGVAALGTCTTRASFSNGGWQNVYLSAPGQNILSTYWNNTYAYLSGTSMAAPHVAGVAAAYFSFNPNYTLLQVARSMFRNADDLGPPGRDGYFGYGRVDMFPGQD
jgi:subtilisin family serine protease